MAGFWAIADLVASAKEFGIFEFYLPFLIMFAVFWAILTKIKLFGDPYGTDKKTSKVAKGINLIVALGASLYIMANTAIGLSFATFLSALFGGTFMVILTIIAFVSVLYVIYSVSTGKNPFELPEGEKQQSKWWIRFAVFALIAAILLVLAVYISSSGMALFPGITLPGISLPSIPTIALPSLGISTQDLAIIFLVVVTGIIIFYVTWGGKGENGGGKKKTTT